MEHKPRRLGYLRGTNIPAIYVSVPVGVVIACATATRIAFSNPPGSEPWLRPLAILMMMVFFSPLAIWGTWLLITDRSTCSKALKNPENSIEKHWSTQAATWTCWIMVNGAAVMAVVAYYMLPILVTYTLLAVTFTGCLVYAISYLVAKLR